VDWFNPRQSIAAVKNRIGGSIALQRYRRLQRYRLLDCILGNFDENEARRLAGAVITYGSHRPRTKYKAQFAFARSFRERSIGLARVC
jgi:hypothetical protein